MKNPFISICIPAYKKLNGLKKLLDSISEQTFSDYEIIISDDTPDDSVKEFTVQYNISAPLIYSKNTPSAGTPENFNIAMKMAKGEWIKIMHDDDWFPDSAALQKFADAAHGTTCSLVFTAFNNIYTHSQKEVHEYLTGWKKEMLDDSTFNLLYLNVIGHPSVTMHRKDDTILYDLSYRWVADVDFYIRYLAKYPGYVYIPEMLINIGTDESQVTNSLYKNPRVEVPEYLSLLSKFPPSLLLKHEYVFHCVWNLVKRFRITDISMIETYGYKGILPDHMQDIINYQKTIPRIILKQTPWSKALMKRCFKKIIKA